MSQWWEHSPPTNVSWVRIPDPASYVGWVCCWFFPLLRGFSPGSPVFLPPQKPTLQIPTRSGISGRIATLWMYHCKFLFIIYLFIYLSIYFYFFIVYYSFPGICIYVKKSCEPGPFLKQAKVAGLPSVIGPAGPNKVLRELVEQIVLSAHSSKEVLQLLASETDKMTIASILKVCLSFFI